MLKLALTFDDGPDPVWTPRLLTLLARVRARATFFPIAPRAQAQPELMAQILAGGHAVGLHCDAHRRHSERDLRWVRRDTETALARLRALGIRPALWRTPWGEEAPWSQRVAREQSLRIVGWSVDSHDWRGDSAQEMYAATRGGLKAGAIVLAHDGIGPGARRTGAAQTLEYVELLAEHAGREGMTLASLS